MTAEYEAAIVVSAAVEELTAAVRAVHAELIIANGLRFAALVASVGSDRACECLADARAGRAFVRGDRDLLEGVKDA